MAGEGTGTVPRTAKKSDWSDWIPVDRATLIFVIRNGEILLIRKKRGLGAGKISGPGGRIEPGESALACALREVEEELRVTPTGVRRRGELRFQFLDGYGIHVIVFSAEGCERVACETEEAAPLWTALGQIPYDEMWEDDRIWLPLLLADETFSGRFVFDGDVMLDAEVDVLSTALR
jgi:8-oxo-dGTP diphosphatase